MTYQGRAVIGGELRGEVLVSRQGFNTLATFKKSILARRKRAVGSDQNNPDTFKKVLTGKVLCLPQTIGSTSGGLVIQLIAELGMAPAALLFSEEIDSLAASGVILASIWSNRDIVTVDRLGSNFLETVQDGMAIEIGADGRVTLPD